MSFAFSMTTLVSVTCRVSVILLIGWILIALLRRANPRWSITVTRSMVAACLVLPFLWIVLPTTPWEVLPAATPVDEALAIAPAAPGGEWSRTLPSSSPSTTNHEQHESLQADTNRGHDRASRAEQLAKTTGNEAERSIVDAAPSQNSGSRGADAIAQPQDLSADRQPSAVVESTRAASATRVQAAEQHSVARLLALVWLMASAFLIFRLIYSMIRTHRLIRSATPAGDELIRDASVVCRKRGTTRIPPIRLTDAVGGPCTAGWLNPVVLLPTGWIDALSSEERQTVLSHELAHVAGRDPLWDLTARLAAAVWWFHPLVWRMPARHRLACEHACDAEAAESAGGFAAYRRQLAAWALQIQSKPSGTIATLAMADRSLLHRRLSWLKHPASAAKPRTKSLVLFAVLMIAILLTTASLTPATRLTVVPTPQPVAPNSISEDQRQSAVRPGSSEVAANDEEPEVQSDIPAKSENAHVIQVVDSDGNPVEGAEVGFGPWYDAEDEIYLRALFNLPKTDEDGKVAIEFPETAVKAHISVVADGFARYSEQFRLSDRKQIVATLIRGNQFRVLAVDEAGNPLPDAYPLLEQSRTWGREFKQLGDGLFVSPSVLKDRKLMRVADAGSKGAMLFSDIIHIDDGALKNEDGVIRAVLKPGVRLEGKLDESVPRPITGGYVDLFIFEGEDHMITRHLEWEDSTHINKDGTFVFESLPPGAHAQLFAVGDGFQSTDLTRQDYMAYLEQHNCGSPEMAKQPIERGIGPHLVPLTGDVAKITIPCRAPTSADIKVVDPGGNPIRGATVSFNPNGSYLGGELFIPATSNSTRRMVEGAGFISLGNVFSWRESSQEWATRNFLSVTTDKDGIARIRNLPGSRPESFEVERAGYVMPVHPNSLDGEGRYAILEMSPGETQYVTFTMERPIPRTIRGVTVLQANGDPVEDVAVAVTHLSFADAPDSWETWSISRFGESVRKVTNQNGDVELSVPEQVGQRKVSAIRVLVQGGYADDSLWTNHTITIPLVEDGGVVRLTDHEPDSDRRPRLTTADYVPAAMISDVSKVGLLAKLLDKPLLATLRQLLIAQNYDALEPIAFAADRAMRQQSAVIHVPLKDGDQVVVLCDVRPKDATWTTKPDGRFAPEAAFLFSAETGELVRVIGGNATADGDYVDIMFCNMGGTDDYFVRTSGFENSGPFKKAAWWYRVGTSGGPAMTFRSYANATSWSGQEQPGDPPAEFAYTEHSFNSTDIERNEPGVTPEGTLVPRQLYWDGRLKKFIGPVTQSYDGKPLYKVELDESSEFKALEPRQGDIVAGGGRRDYEFWHWWKVAAPKNKTVVAKLMLVSDAVDTDPPEVVLFEHPLQSGKVHSLQLQIDPVNQGPQRSFIRIRVNCGNEGEQGVGVPRVELDDSPSVSGQNVSFSNSTRATLFDKQTMENGKRLVWRVETISP